MAPDSATSAAVARASGTALRRSRIPVQIASPPPSPTTAAAMCGQRCQWHISQGGKRPKYWKPSAPRISASANPPSAMATFSGGGRLIGRRSAPRRKSLEFQGISGGVGDEKRGLLARLTLEPDTRLQGERNFQASQFFGQIPPLRHRQNPPKMPHWNRLAINPIMRLVGLLRRA